MNGDTTVEPPTLPLWLSVLPPVLRERFALRTGLHKVVANSGWLLFDKMVRLLLGLVVGTWVARYLGPGQYGEIAYAFAFIAFFQAITSLGLDGIVVRDIAREKGSAGKIIGSAFGIRATVGLVCWVCAVVTMAILEGWGSRSVVITALIGFSLVFQAADTIDLWFQSQSQSKRTVIAKLVSYLFSNGIRVVCILMEAPLVAFAAVAALDGLTAAVGLFVAHRFFPVAGRWVYMRSLAKTLLRESWPYMLSGVSIMLYMRIDQIMLKNILGAESLGVYAAALPFSQLWNIIPMTLCVSLAPLVARKKRESHEAYERALLQIFRVFGATALVVSGVTAFASPFFIPILFGSEFTGTATVLSIHVFTNVWIALGVAQSLWLLNEGKGHLSLYKTLLGVGAAIAGNFLLIPRYGVNGAAISAVMSQAVSAFFSNLIFAPRIFVMQLGIPIKIKHQEYSENV